LIQIETLGGLNMRKLTYMIVVALIAPADISAINLRTDPSCKVLTQVIIDAKALDVCKAEWCKVVTNSAITIPDRIQILDQAVIYAQERKKVVETRLDEMNARGRNIPQVVVGVAFLTVLVVVAMLIHQNSYSDNQFFSSIAELAVKMIKEGINYKGTVIKEITNLQAFINYLRTIQVSPIRAIERAQREKKILEVAMTNLGTATKHMPTIGKGSCQLMGAVYLVAGVVKALHDRPITEQLLQSNGAKFLWPEICLSYKLKSLLYLRFVASIPAIGYLLYIGSATVREGLNYKKIVSDKIATLDAYINYLQQLKQPHVVAG
jgi:hypothetical protein